MKKTNIKIFVLFYLILLAAICLFNYIANPYNVFRSNTLSINPDFNNDPYLEIKLSKNKKFESVIIGGSSVKCLELAKNNENIADISIYYATISDINKLLKYYLKFHPETKKVYFALEIKLFDKREKEIKQIKSNFLTPKELFKLFISIDTTKKSIEKICKKQKTKNKNEEFNLEEIVHLENINKIIPFKNQDEFEKRTKKELEELFKELDKRKIETICFILPAHAKFQLRILDKNNFRNSFVEKQILDKLDYIIDFKIMNKYSQIPINSKNSLFYDESHPNQEYAKIIQEILFKNSNKNKDLYTILTKENYNFESEKENKKLLKYKKENLKEYETYLNREKEIWKKIHQK